MPTYLRQTAGMAQEEEARLDLAAATCPVCLSVLVTPVTLPCRHVLCMPCLDSSMEQASLACPVCRTRISVWLRHTRKAGTLLDEKLWARLQRDFPRQVEARLHGRDVEFSEEEPLPVTPRLSAPGEIRREFERQLALARHEDEEQQTRSERASHQLIESLQKRADERATQEASDERVARDVMRQDLSLSQNRTVDPAGHRTEKGTPRRTSGPLRGPIDVYFGQLTPRIGGKRPVTSLTSEASHTVVFSGTCKENSDPAVAARAASQPSQHSSFDRLPDRLSHSQPSPAASQPSPAAPQTPSSQRHGRHPAPPTLRRQGGDLEALEELPTASIAQPPQLSPPQQARIHSPLRRDVAAGNARIRRRDGVDQDDVAASVAVAGDHPAKRAAPSATVTVPGGAAADQSDLVDLTSAALLQQHLLAEQQLQMELADRKLAEQLQRDLNRVQPVDRSKGSADAYRLRAPPLRARSRTRSRANGRHRSQMSIQQSLAGTSLYRALHRGH